MDRIKLEILESSYWEHFKYAKDLAFFLPIDDPKRKKIEQEVEELRLQIHKLKEKNTK